MKSRTRFDRLSIEELESRTLFSAGALDTSFSGDGMTEFRFMPIDDPVQYVIDSTDVAVQSDGKTVIVGTARPASGSGRQDFAVGRFNLDGKLDPTFGSNGFVTVHVGKSDTSLVEAHAVAIQGDGKIVVAGEALVSQRTDFDVRQFAVIRLMPDGSLDSSFSDDGITTIEFKNGAGANDVAIRADGTIVVAGFHYASLIGDDRDFAVVSLLPDGSGGVQTSFGFGGDDVANALAFGPNGTIVVVGETDGDGGSFALARLTPNLAFDATFNQGGRLRTNLGTRANCAASDVLVQPSGKIVVVGKSVTESVRRPEIVRYLPDGQPDTTFGTAGTGVVETNGLSRATKVIRSADGGLIVGGGSGHFVIAAYTADGVLNTSFGTSGLVVTDFTDNATLTGLAKGPGRRFVAVGGPGAYIARYLDGGANVVHAAPGFDASAAEAGLDPASFFVFREERLPFATRVYFSIGGTATPPGFFTTTPDYKVSGMSISPFAGGTHVDIPANETFTVVTLTPVDDTFVEPLETAVFTILPNSGYEVGTPSSAELVTSSNDTLTFNNIVSRFPNRSVTPVIDEGGVVTLTGTISDSDPHDVFFLSVSWGDGTPVEQHVFADSNGLQVQVRHRYLDDGAYPIQLAWRDKAGEGSAAGLTTTVLNAAPVVDAGGLAHLPPSGVLSRLVIFTDPGRDTWSVTVDFGDGSAAQTIDVQRARPFLLQHRYSQTGAYTVTVTVTDDDGDVGAASWQVQVLESPKAAQLDAFFNLLATDDDSVLRPGIPGRLVGAPRR
jgi:uncharacterized delta-60 repeat protein